MPGTITAKVYSDINCYDLPSLGKMLSFSNGYFEVIVLSLGDRCEFYIDNALCGTAFPKYVSDIPRTFMPLSLKRLVYSPVTPVMVFPPLLTLNDEPWANGSRMGVPTRSDPAQILYPPKNRLRHPKNGCLWLIKNSQLKYYHSYICKSILTFSHDKSVQNGIDWLRINQNLSHQARKLNPSISP